MSAVADSSTVPPAAGDRPATDSTTGPATAPVAERLDRLAAQVDQLTELMLEQKAERERWQELTHELTGVAQGAMTVASRELQDLSADVSAEEVARFLRTAVRTLPQLEVMLTWMASIEELVGEVTSLAGSGMASLSDAMATAETRGYFAAARRSAELADRMALILAGQTDQADAPAPSTLALLRRLRDPQVRLGLARGLDLIQALGMQAPNLQTPNLQKPGVQTPGGEPRSTTSSMPPKE